MTDQTLQASLRALPSVEEVLQALNSSTHETAKSLPHAVKVDIIRKEIDHVRETLLARSSSTEALLTHSSRKEALLPNSSADSHNFADTVKKSIIQSVVAQLTLQALSLIHISEPTRPY